MAKSTAAKARTAKAKAKAAATKKAEEHGPDSLTDEERDLLLDAGDDTEEGEDEAEDTEGSDDTGSVDMAVRPEPKQAPIVRKAAAAAGTDVGGAPASPPEQGDTSALQFMPVRPEPDQSAIAGKARGEGGAPRGQELGAPPGVPARRKSRGIMPPPEEQAGYQPPRATQAELLEAAEAPGRHPWKLLTGYGGDKGTHQAAGSTIWLEGGAEAVRLVKLGAIVPDMAAHETERKTRRRGRDENADG